MYEEENQGTKDKEMVEDEPKIGLWAPFSWLKMLSTEIHWSFVLGIILVYGVSQGVGGSLNCVGTEYYMKDVQKVQPSEAQIYQGITSIPWMVKPLWGLMTDVIPVLGYRRRPYFIFAGNVLPSLVVKDFIHFASLLLQLVAFLSWASCSYFHHTCLIYTLEVILDQVVSLKAKHIVWGLYCFVLLVVNF